MPSGSLISLSQIKGAEGSFVNGEQGYRKIYVTLSGVWPGSGCREELKEYPETDRKIMKPFLAQVTAKHWSSHLYSWPSHQGSEHRCEQN